MTKPTKPKCGARELRPYQRTMVEWTKMYLEAHPIALIVAQLGTGKTFIRTRERRLR